LGAFSIITYVIIIIIIIIIITYVGNVGFNGGSVADMTRTHGFRQDQNAVLLAG
jgi:hypothetical protein